MWQLVLGGWSNNVVCSDYLSLLESMIRRRMCDISHTHLHCNNFIEHYVIALDIMTLHWTCCCRLLLSIPILSAVSVAGSVFLHSYEYGYYYDSFLCAHVQSERLMVCWIVPHFWSWTHVYCLKIRSHCDETSSLHRHFHQARKHLLTVYIHI